MLNSRISLAAEEINRPRLSKRIIILSPTFFFCDITNYKGQLFRVYIQPVPYICRVRFKPVSGLL